MAQIKIRVTVPVENSALIRHLAAFFTESASNLSIPTSKQEILDIVRTRLEVAVAGQVDLAPAGVGDFVSVATSLVNKYFGETKATPATKAPSKPKGVKAAPSVLNPPPAEKTS
jgi:hypothetical protein